MENRIRDEVEETLASLDRMERLEAGPAFFSRLKARLDARGGQPAASGLLLFPQVFLPVLRPVLLAGLILINFLTIGFAAKVSPSREAANGTSATTVAADYSLTQDLDELSFTREVGK